MGPEMRRAQCSLTDRQEAGEAAYSLGRMRGLLMDSPLGTMPKGTPCLLPIPSLNYPEKLLVRLAGGRAHRTLKRPY